MKKSRFALVALSWSCLAASAALAGGQVQEALSGGGEGSADWLSQVTNALAEREYEATDNGIGLQAPNRRHDFRAYFEPSGLRLVDRTAAGSPELAQVRVVAIARGGVRSAVTGGALSRPDGRLTIERGAGVREEFENGTEGLEHQISLAEPPTGDGEFTLILRIRTATIEAADEGVMLRAPTGRALSMRRLPVVDATGRLLPSRLEASGSSRLRVVVTDQAAVYPLRFKFIFTGNTGTPSWTLQGNQAGASLGISAAGVGDVDGDGFADVLVGANGYDLGQSEEGAAFLFHGTVGGISVGHPANAETVFEGNQAGSGFGFSVAGAGDVNGDGYADVVIGANFYDSGESNEGAAFVFLGSSGGIADGNPATAAATLQGDQVNASFGTSVASADDVNGDGYADVVVGAGGYDSGQVNEGGAFVFHGSATGIASSGIGGAATTLQGNQNDAGLGTSVASAGDVNGDGFSDLLVGAWGYDSGETNEGGAFVFHGSAAGIVSGGPTSASATLQGNQVDANFGLSVSSAGDVNGDGFADVIVGALNYDAGETNEGAAFVFDGGVGGVGNGNPSSALSTLQANFTSARFGISVAAAGDVNGDGYSDVIVGAYLMNPGGGAAFVFLGSPSGMVFDPQNIAGAAALLQILQVDADFGVAVAGAGDVNGDGYADVVVGARHWESAVGEADEGAAFVYWGSAAGIASGGTSTAATALEGNQAGGALGVSVAGAGDVNGDGYADVLVGASNYDSGAALEGAAFIFSGSSAGVGDASPATAATKLEGNQTGSQFGRSVAGAGDVNGDGFSDVIVGMPGFSSGETAEGAALVFLGSAAGVANGNPATAAAVLQADQASAELGFSVAGAGDVNGDGYADVIVGSAVYDLPEANEGVALVFHGSAVGIVSGGPSSAAAVLQGDQVGALYGYDVAGTGDVNGDGYADVVVGARNYDAGQPDEGGAFVYHGGPAGVASGSPTSAATLLEGNQGLALFGESVAGAGDVNGDGYADILVGAPVYDSGEMDEGAAFVFLGSASGIPGGGPATAAAQIQGNQAFALLGSVGGAGDVNGDGFADILVGAYGYDDGTPGSDEGAAFVFLGSSAGIASGGPADADAELFGEQAAASFGFAVAGAGDVNGDGYADIIVGAFNHDSGHTNEGGAFVFLGNARGNTAGINGLGRRVLAQQLRLDSGTPVAAWSGSLGIAGFDARLRNYHPAGGGRVKFEVEACPAGVAFGLSGCVKKISGSWADVTASDGALLNQSVTGLTAARLYHWRARTLYAPTTVTKPGITAPPKPAHGPWRRLSGQAVEADIRTLGGVFYTLAPCRVVDTRSGSGAPIGAPVLTSGLERTLPLTNKCGLPTTARAVSVNLTAVSPSGPGQLVLYPKSGEVTNTSNLSFNTGSNRANNSVLGLNALGQMQILATVANPAGPDEVHLIVDVNGYFE